MLLKYINQFLLLTLPYHFDRAVFCYQLSEVKFCFTGFGTFLTILYAVQSHFQFLALLSSLLPVLLLVTLTHSGQEYLAC